MGTLRSVTLGLVGVSVLAVFVGCVGDDSGTPDGGDASSSPDAPSDVTSSDVVSDASVDAGRCDPNKPFGAPTPVAELNSAFDDSAPHLSWDELTVYFSRRPTSDTDPFKLYYAQRSSPSDTFGTPALLPNLNSAADAGLNDLQPMVAKNDLALYFTSDRASTFDLFTATRTTGGSPSQSPFGNVAPLTNLNHSDRSESRPFLSADATELWYTANAGSGQPFQIYRALGPTFATGSAIPDLNTAGANSSPTLSADGLTMYFSSDRTGGTGGLDIWFAKRASTSAAFQAAVSLSTVNAAFNSSADDVPAWLSPDDCVFWMATERSGNLDIYVAARPK
jgi:hypothetical protein